MIFLYRSLFGYVKIQISGANPEQVINLFVNSGITLWGLKRNSKGITCYISINDYKNMLRLRHKLREKVQIKLLKKYGLPIVSKNIRKRPGIVAGLCFLILINLFLSQFIWSVDVKNVDSEKYDEIKYACSRAGIAPGTLKKSVDTYTVSQKLLLDVKGVAWLSVNIEGSVATVNLTETDEPLKETDLPCNQIAKCDGVILSYKIYDGANMVSVGRAVREGDILISGLLTHEETVQKLHAKGEVIAATERIFKTKIPKKYKCKKRISIKNKYVLNFFSVNIPLYLSDVKNAIPISADSRFVEISGKPMPIGIYNKRFERYDFYELNLDKDEAEQIAIMQMTDVIRTLDIQAVENYELSVIEDEEFYIISFTLKCREEITTPDYI
jgi:similar to stage IV sporulation protein